MHTGKEVRVVNGKVSIDSEFDIVLLESKNKSPLPPTLRLSKGVTKPKSQTKFKFSI
jgi:hypothetical protein